MPTTNSPRTVEVFADVMCPFAHVGLRRFISERDGRGKSDIVLRVRAWPLENVNGHAEAGTDVAAKVQALRDSVAPEMFRSFDADRFPSTSMPALAAEAAAYSIDPFRGEQFSLAVRTALFENGSDITDPGVLSQLPGAPDDASAGVDQVLQDWHDGQSRSVTGSPHFFIDGDDFFCPSMTIERTGGVLEIEFDKGGFTEFLERALN